VSTDEDFVPVSLCAEFSISCPADVSSEDSLSLQPSLRGFLFSVINPCLYRRGNPGIFFLRVLVSLLLPVSKPSLVRLAARVSVAST
jgi:hypothetical protein